MDDKPMELVRDPAQLPSSETQAVIINCGTKWITSLALLSAHKNTSCPVLVIDCESDDGSKVHFERLAARQRLHFYWLEWPLRPHPVTLDHLFRVIPSERVLLIDSDVEIKTRNVFDAMQRALARESNAYGAGFLHGPEWFGREHGLPAFTGYYAERMWVPLVLLKSSTVRGILNAGHSFMNRRPFFEVPSWPRLSRMLGYRYRLRGLRNVPLWTQRHSSNRPVIDGHLPAFIEYDTGADLHKELKQRGYSLASLPGELWNDVHHYHGVTRAHLAGTLRRSVKLLRLASRETETEQRRIISVVRQRLATAYGFNGF
jgi:hypothetical protein